MIDKINDLFYILKSNLIPNQAYAIGTEDANLLKDIIIVCYFFG